jgi:GNAT superfamily N-acetyltransferase
MTTANTILLREEHFDLVWDIFTAVFPAKYGDEFMDAWMDRNRNLSYGMFGSDGGLHGFILTTQTKSYASHTQKIEFLGVNPSCQKGGIGTQLLKLILDYCLRTNSRATLIPVNDPRIIHWYNKHGFVNYGQPFVSTYTGDIEQLMVFNHSASPGPSLGNGSEETAHHYRQVPSLQQDTRTELETRVARESLRLLMA